MSKSKLQVLIILVDWLMAVIAWGAFFYYRKVYLEQTNFELSERFYYGISIIPICWIALYTLIGTYLTPLRWHRMKILAQTAKAVLIGTLAIFFVFLIDDQFSGYQVYYKALFAVAILQFGLTIIPRFLITTVIVRKVHSGKIGFNTLLVGGSQKAVAIYKEIVSLPKSMGNRFIGFANLNGIDKELESELPYLGHADNLEQVLADNPIDEIIIALDSTEHERLKQIISKVHGRDIKIKIIPDMYDILSGIVKMDNLFGAILIEVKSEILPTWQKVIKRLIDVFASAIAMILLTPIYLTLAILVKTSSKGPILFRQERIGIHGKPFKIIKFRTMYVDAEKAGPQLSSTHDPRITKIGRFMRKARLDEFPQFWNVVKGEMSLVGPRPERQFFIDQIVEKEPQFLELNKVKPGITSWGQVKYGYAENVEEMIQRMKFDLLYLKNMSIALDFKIMLYTVLIIIKAKGK